MNNIESKQAILFIEPPRNAPYYISEIKKKGLEVLVLQNNTINSSIDKDLEGIVLFSVNLWNRNKVLNFVKNEILTKYNILRIITHQENFVELTAYLEESTMQNTFLNSTIAKACRDKYLMRQKIEKLKYFTPKYNVLNNLNDAKEFYNDVKKDIILKPRYGTASMGVTKISSTSELSEYFSKVKLNTLLYKNGDELNIIAEEFVSGQEYGIETLMVDGKLELFIISEKPKPFEPPYFEESIYLHYPDLSDDDFVRIKRSIEQLNIGFGIINGPSHVEIIRTESNELFIIEIAARNGSAFKYLSQIIDDSFEKIQLNNYLNIKNSTNIIRTTNNFNAYYLLQSPGKGMITDIKGVEEAKLIDGIVDIDIFKHKGDNVVEYPFFNGYIGTIYAQHESKDILLNNLEKAHSTISINIDKYLKNDNKNS